MGTGGGAGEGWLNPLAERPESKPLSRWFALSVLLLIIGGGAGGGALPALAPTAAAGVAGPPADRPGPPLPPRATDLSATTVSSMPVGTPTLRITASFSFRKRASASRLEIARLSGGRRRKRMAGAIGGGAGAGQNKARQDKVI